MSRLARHGFGAALAMIAACTDATNTSPSQLNLDRPIDIAFACYGGLRVTNGGLASPDQDVITTAMPTAACEIRSGAHDTGTPVPVPPGQEDLTAQGSAPIPGANWFGFILQSGTGTVVISSFATKPSSAFAGGDVLVLDADPLTPGKNGISIGEDPIAIATDRGGCKEVVANAGSCDLSILDIGSTLDSDPAVTVDRLEIKNASGQPMRARPAAMAAEPNGGTIGQKCSANASGLVYLAYPSCHLVAAVDTSTGTIVAGIQYDAAGTPTLTDGNVSCPAECGGGGTITPGVRPVALDLEQDPRTGTRRLVIGAENSASLTLVELGVPDSMPQSLSQIALENTTGTLGVSNVAVTPVIGMGGSSGIVTDVGAPGGQSQFVYAVASDNTVRVADILGVRKECDAQVDPRLINDVKNVKTLSCFPVGDPATPARRPGALGPGIALVAGAVPLSVEVFKSAEIENDPRLQSPTKLVGYFGIITAANGATFLFDVDDDDYPDFKDANDPLGVQLTNAIAHQLRDAVPSRSVKATVEKDGQVLPICQTTGPDPDAASGVAGGPRATGTPTRAVPAGTIAAEKVTELPSIHQVQCVGSDTTEPVSELGFAAPDLVRDLAFPDLRALRGDEGWTMTYEGSLSLDKTDTANDGPSIRESQIFVDTTGMRLSDQTHPFCDAGVEPHDIVQLRGCDPAQGDGDCPLGYTCYVHPNSQVVGLGACMLNDEADRLSNACRDFLTSSRRYTVGHTESGQLQLLPRKHVLQTTPTDGCTSDSQCKMLADYAAKQATSNQPVDAIAEDKHTYSCVTDPDRAPVNADPSRNKRCVETCTTSGDCTAGHVCGAAGYCMEGVIPPQACVNAPQRYELRASEAFTVVGTRSGYVHPIIADSGGKCVRDPAAHPFTMGRIPLSAPACDPTSDPRTGKNPAGVYEPNPCSVTVDQTELVPAYVPGTCTTASPATTLATFPVPAIRFRNRGLSFTLVDPTYPGDQMCVKDRGGMLGNVPLAFPGFQLAFRQAAGFVPLLLPIAPSFPIKVVRGPTESIWVMDEGDFLSTSITQASTRGKVFRLEPQALAQVNLLE